MRELKQIQKAINKMIEDTSITPNKIKMCSSDICKLQELCKYFYGDNGEFKINAIFGLQIIEDSFLKEGNAIIYNDKFLIEIIKERN